jgi:hypothetical protein
VWLCAHLQGENITARRLSHRLTARSGSMSTARSQRRCEWWCEAERGETGSGEVMACGRPTRAGVHDVPGESSIRLPSIFSLAADGPRWRGLPWPSRHFIKQIVGMSGLADLDMPTTVLGNPGYTGVGSSHKIRSCSAFVCVGARLRLEVTTRKPGSDHGGTATVHRPTKQSKSKIE